jgi:hypothetical protein
MSTQRAKKEKLTRGQTLNKWGWGHIGEAEGQNGDGTTWKYWVLIDRHLYEVSRHQSFEEAEAAADKLSLPKDEDIVNVNAKGSAYHTYRRRVTYISQKKAP